MRKHMQTKPVKRQQQAEGSENERTRRKHCSWRETEVKPGERWRSMTEEGKHTFTWQVEAETKRDSLWWESWTWQYRQWDTEEANTSPHWCRLTNTDTPETPAQDGPLLASHLTFNQRKHQNLLEVIMNDLHRKLSSAVVWIHRSAAARSLLYMQVSSWMHILPVLFMRY